MLKEWKAARSRLLTKNYIYSNAEKAISRTRVHM